MNLYKEHTHCRACGSVLLVPVFDLGEQALANCFRTPDEPPAPTAPLRVLYCEDCTLGQLSVVVDPRILYADYAYSTPSSVAQTEHMTKLAAELVREGGERIECALEIGSNEGAFLDALRKAGYRKVLGVEPSMRHCEAAIRNRQIPSYNFLFTEKNTATIPPVDLVVARHVFAHVDDWPDFIRGLLAITHSQSLIAIEVPSTHALLSNLLWDTIYHEHTSYLTLHALGALLRGTPLRVDRVLSYPLHGGSQVFLLRYRDRMPTPVALNEPWITREDWLKFSRFSVIQREWLVRSVVKANAVGSVAGYGAPAKAAVVAQACRWSNADLEFVTDTTPEKIGRLIPGTNIPVVGEDRLESRGTRSAVLFAWNYQREITGRMKPFLDRGGKFILPHSP